MSANVYAEESGTKAEEDGFPHDGLVEVEHYDLVPPVPPDRDYHLRPYRDRRTSWGGLVGLSAGYYNPSNYLPSFVSESYSNLYGTPTNPLVELNIVFKRNFNFGAIAAELGGGYFSSQSSDPVINSNLELYHYRLGVGLILETLFSEPWVVPYGYAGAYIIQYKESLRDISYNGNTKVAPYFTIGAQFSLDWLDRTSAMISYNDSGVMGTYLFLENRIYLASSDKSDPDFSTYLAPSAGLRIEF